MLSAASCGYATGDFWIGDGCGDQSGYWGDGLCYIIGARQSTPRGWQSVQAPELAAVKDVAHDWGRLTASGADLDGDGEGDSIAVLVDPTLTQFRVFAFFSRDHFSGAAARALTEARPIAEMDAVSVEFNKPAPSSTAAASFTLRQRVGWTTNDITYTWADGRLVEVAS
ncbi:hypothetical protein [Phenylobacterium sp.]|uniref:hypothetical protein n=1 Tax=Phenylobacterium sp. TaxID=1871053 RepID=UPI00273010F8|nr:hypothetical protein [Phenylobacterium sp.]MDP1616792.1 hypothetical protein [Phenylobacterium sp.]MDP1986263.1 hypothetical protein [Phenylobacterium sp.]